MLCESFISVNADNQRLSRRSHVNIHNTFVQRALKQIAACALFCIAPSFAYASADGCVRSEGGFNGGGYTISGVTSCVDVRGSGLKIDSLRAGGELQSGVAVWGSVYITMPNGVAFFTPTQYFDNASGLRANTKWTTFYSVGYAVPKGKVCAAFYEWTGNQWAAHSPACVSIK
jgi:hypothetical protein